MPCRVDEFDSPEDMQHREAAKLRIVLCKFQKKSIPDNLPHVASGFYRGWHEVQRLCDELKALGGGDYIAGLLEAYPGNPDVIELQAWWLKHEAADLRRKTAAEKAARQKEVKAKKDALKRESAIQEARSQIVGELFQCLAQHEGDAFLSMVIGIRNRWIDDNPLVDGAVWNRAVAEFDTLVNTLGAEGQARRGSAYIGA